MNRRTGDFGAYMVELALALPVLLTIFLACLWLSHILVARSGLNFGMQTALRLAASRGEATVKEAGRNVGVIQAVHDWHDPYFDAPPSESLQDLLNSAYPSNWSMAETYFQEKVVPPYYSNASAQSSDSRLPLRQLPLAYTYALTYVHQAMRQNVGAFVKFPCPVECSRPSTPDRPCGGGCMTCEFSVPEGAAAITSSPTGESLELTCHYAVPSPLQKLLSVTLSALTGRLASVPEVVITRHAIMSVS